MAAADLTLRPAAPADVPAIAALMQASVTDIFPRFYSAQQTASALVHVAVPDVDLVADGTYFVVEAEGSVIACGGWSRRDKLYAGSAAGDSDARLLDPASEPARVRAMFVDPAWTRRGLGRRILEACVDAARGEGFSRLALMATLPGVPLYLAFGFSEDRRVEIVLADGVRKEAVEMSLAIPPAAPQACASTISS